jgi:hypothetical protein
MMDAKRICTMDNSLSEVFDQARQLVAEADRRVAETEKRRREIEGQAKLAELVVRAEEAFDFTSREKLELDPRMDVHEDVAVIEFVVRAARAIIVLAPKDDVMWDLLVVEDGKNVSSVAEIVGGIKAEPNSRRLAAARVVASIAIWVEKNRQRRAAAASQVSEQPVSQALPQAKSQQSQGTFPVQADVVDAAQTAASGMPPYERRDRRTVDAAPAAQQPHHDETIAARAPSSPVMPRSVPAQNTAPVPQRASYGTFGKFFGH